MNTTTPNLNYLQLLPSIEEELTKVKQINLLTSKSRGSNCLEASLNCMSMPNEGYFTPSSLSDSVVNLSLYNLTNIHAITANIQHITANIQSQSIQNNGSDNNLASLANKPDRSLKSTLKSTLNSAIGLDNILLNTSTDAINSAISTPMDDFYISSTRVPESTKANSLSGGLDQVLLPLAESASISFIATDRSSMKANINGHEITQLSTSESKTNGIQSNLNHDRVDKLQNSLNSKLVNSITNSNLSSYHQAATTNLSDGLPCNEQQTSPHQHDKYSYSDLIVSRLHTVTPAKKQGATGDGIINHLNAMPTDGCAMRSEINNQPALNVDTIAEVLPIPISVAEDFQSASNSSNLSSKQMNTQLSDISIASMDMTPMMTVTDTLPSGCVAKDTNNTMLVMPNSLTFDHSKSLASLIPQQLSSIVSSIDSFGLTLPCAESEMILLPKTAIDTTVVNQTQASNVEEAQIATVDDSSKKSISLPYQVANESISISMPELADQAEPVHTFKHEQGTAKLPESSIISQDINQQTALSLPLLQSEHHNDLSTLSLLNEANHTKETSTASVLGRYNGLNQLPLGSNPIADEKIVYPSQAQKNNEPINTSIMALSSQMDQLNREIIEQSSVKLPHAEPLNIHNNKTSSHMSVLAQDLPSSLASLTTTTDTIVASKSCLSELKQDELSQQLPLSDTDDKVLYTHMDSRNNPFVHKNNQSSIALQNEFSCISTSVSPEEHVINQDMDSVELAMSSGLFMVPIHPHKSSYSLDEQLRNTKTDLSPKLNPLQTKLDDRFHSNQLCRSEINSVANISADTTLTNQSELTSLMAESERLPSSSTSSMPSMVYSSKSTQVEHDETIAQPISDQHSIEPAELIGINKVANVDAVVDNSAPISHEAVQDKTVTKIGQDKPDLIENYQICKSEMVCTTELARYRAASKQVQLSTNQIEQYTQRAAEKNYLGNSLSMALSTSCLSISHIGKYIVGICAGFYYRHVLSSTYKDLKSHNKILYRSCSAFSTE